MHLRLTAFTVLALTVCAVVAINPQSSPGGPTVIKASGKPIRPHDSIVTLMAVSTEGRQLAYAGEGDAVVRLWSLPQGNALRKLSGHKGGVRSLAFTPDGRLLAVASGDNTVLVWSVSDGRRVATLTGHTAEVKAVYVTPDGRYVLTAAHDDQRVGWSVLDGKNELSTWSLPDGKLVKTSPVPAELSSCLGNDSSCAVMTPDGLMFAVGGVRVQEPDLCPIVLFSLPDLQQVATLASGSTGALAVTPDGATLVAASARGITLWSIADHRVLRRVDGTGVAVQAVATDGQTLVAAEGGGGLRAWNLSDLRQTGVMSGHTRTIKALAISPDGRWVASGSDDSTTRLWSLPDGLPVAVFEGQGGEVRHVRFTPDGSALITAEDATMQIIARANAGIELRYAGGYVVLWSVNPPAFRRYLGK